MDAIGDGSQELYLVFNEGSEVYETFGIHMIGAFSSESLFIHFVDAQSKQAWRSTNRSIEFTALDYDFHAWEGEFSLNADEEVTTEDDQYEYATIDLSAPASTDDYDDAVQDLLVDTEVVNNYDPAVLVDFIEYSMVSMGVGGTNAITLSGIISDAGETHSLDMTVK